MPNKLSVREATPTSRNFDSNMTITGLARQAPDPPPGPEAGEYSAGQTRPRQARRLRGQQTGHGAHGAHRWAVADII